MPAGLRFAAACCAIAAFIASAGCSPNTPTPQAPPPAAVVEAPPLDPLIVPIPEEDVEVSVSLPVPPVDDGLPLSSPEEIALASTSELDANIGPEDFEEVELNFKYILHRGRATFERALARSAPYLPYIREVFKEYGVPEEIAYLAFVESGFNPNAVSRAGATGMWQFMPGTGKLFDLNQSWWADERRDPYKATVAAAQYLAALNERFCDWGLAMAAYNAGEGKISRALNGTGAENFFDLCNKNDMLEARARLKAETRQYVPRFMAIIKVMRNLEILGFTPPQLPDKPLVEALEVKPGTDLMALAGALGMEWPHFSALNPALFRYISPPNAPATVYLPPQMTEKAVAHLKNPPRSYAGWQLYTVQRGDTYSQISRRSGVPVNILQQLNNSKTTSLRIGQKIMIPGTPQNTAKETVTASANTPKPAAASAPKPGQTSSRSTAANTPKPAAPKPTAQAKGSSYVVKQGDTLYSIARKAGLTVETIQKANNISTTRLKIGQVLILPATANPAAATRQSSL